jgi:hypothetical protein
MKKSAVFITLFIALNAAIGQNYSPNSVLCQIKWSDHVMQKKDYPGIVSSFTAYDFLNDSTIAFLLSDEQKIIIYSISRKKVQKEISLPYTSIDFHCKDGMFYLLDFNKFYILDDDGAIVKEYNYTIPKGVSFAIEKIDHHDGKNLIMVADGSTYEVTEKGLSKVDARFWYFRDYLGRVEKRDMRMFELTIATHRQMVFNQLFLIDEMGLPGDLATVAIVDIKENEIFLDIETATNIKGDLPKRFLVQIDHKGKFISATTIPFVYYTYLKNHFASINNRMIYALIAPEGIFFYPLNKKNNRIELPVGCPDNLHYNFFVEHDDSDSAGVQSFTTNDNTTTGSNCVTRTQAWQNAFKFRDLSWSATSGNIRSSCATLSGNYYKTPVWVTVGSKQSVPYKWGGWTDWDDFASLATQGKYAGSYATTSSSSPCPQPPYASSSDTYIIGDDCSGFVSRCWETSTKYSTSGLPGICQNMGSATSSSAFSQLQPGDVVNDAGSHVRLCLSQNPSGSASFMEASAVDWRVSERSYTMTQLTGYTCLKYNNINDARLRLAQAITISPSTVVQGGSLTVTYKVGNYGSESWTGSVRLYIKQSDGDLLILQTQGPITLGPSQVSSTYTFTSTSVLSPVGTTELEVRVVNSSTSCNYGRDYKAGEDTYENPLIFTIYPCVVPSPPGTISGPSSPCKGSTGNNYYVSNVSGITYTWSYSGSGYTITSGQGSNSILVTYSSSATSGTWTVTPSNNCGNGQTQNKTISVVYVPVQLPVSNVTISGGQNNCYNATQTITLAGSGTSFKILSAGSATMMAGQNILYLPGTKVYSGGYMHGYITSAGNCCGVNRIAFSENSNLSETGNDATIPLSSKGSAFFRVYPNPTSGNFTLEFNGDYVFTIVNVEVFGMRGEKVLAKVLAGERKYEFSLADLPAGIYFIRVISASKAVSLKIIKQ